MAITYPGTIQTFVNPVGTNTLDSPDHAGLHSDVADTAEAIQTVVGTTAGTAVLMNFTAGQFPIKQEGGTLVETITGGTINATTLGTPTVTGGDFASPTTTGTDAGTATFTNKTLTSPVIQAYAGWQDANETWTFAAIDAPSFTFTIAAFDATTKYSVGMRIKLTNASVKYFIITKVTFDDPGSTITVYGGTDYALVDAAITTNYYSTQKAPLDFPLDPDKWTVETVDASGRIETTPTANTWYNTGTITINVPIGAWNLGYEANIQIDDTAAGNCSMAVTLSTANNSESISRYTGAVRGAGVTVIIGYVSREQVISLATKDTYYLNVMTNVSSMDNIRIKGDDGDTIVRAVCAYL